MKYSDGLEALLVPVDPFAGWGTSLKAAVRVGMVWEGWEIDEEKVAAIVEWWESGGESDSGIV